MKCSYEVVDADQPFISGSPLVLYSLTVSDSPGITFNLNELAADGTVSGTVVMTLTVVTDPTTFTFPYGVQLPRGGALSGGPANPATIGYTKIQ